MNASVKKFWYGTILNATTIFCAIATLFSVNGTILFYLSLITAAGLILYYYEAVTTEPQRSTESDSSAVAPGSDNGALIARKLWRITEANGIWIAMSVCTIYALEGTLAIITICFTVLGFALYYIYSYPTIELHIIDFAALPPFSWRTFAKNMWTITEANALTVAGSLSLLLYVSGQALMYNALFVTVGFVLFYIDAYRPYLKPEPPAVSDEAPHTDHQRGSTTIPLTSEE